jgi:hypothetical protein
MDDAVEKDCPESLIIANVQPEGRMVLLILKNHSFVVFEKTVAFNTSN